MDQMVWLPEEGPGCKDPTSPRVNVIHVFQKVNSNLGTCVPHTYYDAVNSVLFPLSH
jgi:hypothetical protein